MERWETNRFMEYDREENLTATEPKERIRILNEFHIPLSQKKTS